MFDSRRSVLNALALLAVVIVVGIFVVFAVPQAVGADHSYVVLSNSMSPTMSAGDAVVVEEVPASSIEAGAIITFQRVGDTGAGAPTDKVTHRVVDVVDRDDGRYFRTKGDANEEPDGELVPASNVVGVVMFSIPYIGYVADFVDTGVGLLLLVVLPAVLLIANELWTLWIAATEDDA